MNFVTVLGTKEGQKYYEGIYTPNQETYQDLPVSTPKIHYNKVIYGKDVQTKEFKKRNDLLLKNVDLDTNLPELPKTPLAALPVLETEDLYEFILENKKKGAENSRNKKEFKDKPRAVSFHRKPADEPKELTLE